MPTYRVKSGDMDVNIETAHEAQAKFLCVIAVERAKPKHLGAIMSVTGGQYTGDNEVFVHSLRVLECIGMAPGNKAV